MRCAASGGPARAVGSSTARLVPLVRDRVRVSNPNPNPNPSPRALVIRLPLVHVLLYCTTDGLICQLLALSPTPTPTVTLTLTLTLTPALTLTLTPALTLTLTPALTLTLTLTLTLNRLAASPTRVVATREPSRPWPGGGGGA